MTATLGTHSITITAPASGKVYMIGISANVGSSGARVHNVGKSGEVIAGIAYNYRKDFIDVVQAQLTVVAMVANDFSAQTDLATYRSRVEAVILKAINYGSVLLVGANESSLAGKVVPQKSYHAQLISLADQYNCAYVDMFDRWKNYTTANGLGLMYDTIHPNTKGHADQAKGILRHLLEVM